MKKNWRNSREYQQWHDAVIARDCKCQVCGSREHLHAHHKDHATYFKDKRFDIDNGVTVCSSCHMNFHNNYKRSYRQKCTEYDWNNFLSLVNYFKKLWKDENPDREN